MEELLYYAHSGLRWLVVLLTFVAFIWLLVGYGRNKPFDKRTHMIVVAWASLIGVQWILGIVLFLVLGGFDVGYRWEHTLIMTLVLAAAHAYVPLKRRADTVRYQGVLISIGAALLLTYVGVARLPQGWSMEVSYVSVDEVEPEEADEDTSESSFPIIKIW